MKLLAVLLVCGVMVGCDRPPEFHYRDKVITEFGRIGIVYDFERIDLPWEEHRYLVIYEEGDSERILGKRLTRNAK